MLRGEEKSDIIVCAYDLSSQEAERITSFKTAGAKLVRSCFKKNIKINKNRNKKQRGTAGKGLVTQCEDLCLVPPNPQGHSLRCL